jgi:MinD superfamily P-loop ATPase
MKIAIASGKGGTGKTLISTNLARVALEKGRVCLFDLDVEEPNAHLFFQQIKQQSQAVEKMIPVVDDSICELSGVCSKVCEYHAIITLANQVMVFPELCHSCYGCLEMCPSHAISEGKKQIGQIKHGTKNGLQLVSGLLKVGESSTTALIRDVKKFPVQECEWYIYDAPPGTSCPVIETVKDLDYVVLVGEPTPFGLHDLNLLVQVLQEIGQPFGVVVNKSVPGNERIEKYCAQKDIDILTHIPLRSDIAGAYAKGQLASEVLPDMHVLFTELLETVKQKVDGTVS